MLYFKLFDIIYNMIIVIFLSAGVYLSYWSQGEIKHISLVLVARTNLLISQ